MHELAASTFSMHWTKGWVDFLVGVIVGMGLVLAFVHGKLKG